MSDLFNPETGEIRQPEGSAEDCGKCQRLEAQLEAVKTDLDLAEKQIRTQRRKIGGLEKELRDVRKESPKRREAQEVYEHWLEETGRSASRSKFGDKREKAVLARLFEDRSVDYLQTAVTGLRIGANVSDHDTQRQTLMAVMRAAIEAVDEGTAKSLRAMYREGMKGIQVYDDLELVCRNEVNVERFYEIGKRLGGDALPANSGE